jgi:hypothetical protein
MALALAVTLVGCGPAGNASLPVDENLLTRKAALDRFRGDLDSVTSLTGGETSRDSLVAGFVRALETRDTATLQRLSMTVEEFAYLYYPTNPQSLPPYDLRPALMWQILRLDHERGLGRLLADRSGYPLNMMGYSCDSVVSRQGENRITGPCLIHRRGSGGAELTERLFGLIIDRRGRFKFVSYANSLE